MDSGGYDVEFVNPLSDDYQCAICLLAFRDPVQLDCGHQFCRSCQTMTGDKCPLDNQKIELNQIFSDKALRRKILGLKVKCKYNQDGCVWNGELRDLEIHINPCSLQECSQSQNFEQQLKMQCIFRPTVCKYCKETYKIKDEKIHNEVCEQLPLECMNNCGLKDMIRAELTKHIAEDCPLAEILCAFYCIGCKFKDKRCAMENHEKQMVHQHLAMALTQITTQQTQMVLTSESINEVKSEFTHKIENESAIQQNEIKSLKNELIIQKDVLETHIAELKNKVEKQKTEIEELKQKTFEYTWKIEFSDRRGYDLSIMSHIYSEEFYTAKIGYKLKLSLNENQCVPNENQCVSYAQGNYHNNYTNIYRYGKMFISMQIIKGDYDEQLPWPFKKRFKLSLLDQSGNNENKSVIIDPKDYNLRDAYMIYQQNQYFGKQEWFVKPNEKNGNPCFHGLDIPINTLENPPYNKNGILIIKCEVINTTTFTEK